MRSKPFDDYSPAHLRMLRSILSELFIALGEMSKDLYLVGGLVPDLLVDCNLAYIKEYLGTLDIDLAIKFVISRKTKYADLYNILRSLGFDKQKTMDGRDVMSHSFMKYESGYKPIIIDLITDSNLKPTSDKLKEIAPNVDAVKFRGVYLVFKDNLEINLGNTKNRPVKIRIPNIIPFLTLKSFAYSDEDGRSAKDAYDIWYTIVNYRNGPASVKEELVKYKGNRDVADAFKHIQHDFMDESSSGTKDVVDILVRRYGLERAFAIKEVLSPLKYLVNAL
jgi:hypothetical protein